MGVLTEPGTTMAVWTVAGVCAVAAGESAATVSYAAIAASRWFMPAGVIVSAIAAGILGVTMGADPLLATRRRRWRCAGSRDSWV